MAKTPTWQRAEGKNPEGGLNEKGRASLRAAGHDIKRPQPEGGPRKRSFCARMEGMKRENTSAETANDPNSRINKSLRKWKCADGGAVDPYDAVQHAAKGGEVWDKPRPKKLGKPEPLSSKEKKSAKAAAKAAGRPYPNLIDNMRAARADGGEADPYDAVQNAANTDALPSNFSAEDIQRASHGATPAVPTLSVTENVVPSTPAADSLRSAYNAAIPPTARLLAEGAMGIHTPITEADFSQSDIQNMKDRLVEQQQLNAEREKNLQDIQNFMTPEKYRHYQAMTEQPITGEGDYRRMMQHNAEKLQSFQNTRGQTSVPYGTTFGKEDQPNQPLSVYSNEQGGIANAINRSYNDPGYRTGMTLGRFNVYDTPQGRIAVDNYDFRGTKQSLSDIAHDFQTKPGVTALRRAIPTLLPNIERPVAINLDKPGNYTYTGKPILTPGSHLDPDQTQTPRQDEIADYKTKTPGFWQFNKSAQESRTPNVTAMLPPRRPASFADGGEVDDRAHEFVQQQLQSGEPQVPQYVAENDFPARAARGIEAVDTAASKVNNLLANVAGQPAMRSPEGRTASEVVQSAMPVDPYKAVQQAANQWQSGNKLDAAQTMLANIPQTGMFIGQKANLSNAERSQMQNAADMYAAQKDRDAILKNTGFIQGYGGELKTEISDVGSTFNPAKFDYRKIQMVDPNTGQMANYTLPLQRAYLPDVLPHPTLYDRYPHLTKMEVAIDPRSEADAYYMPGKNNEGLIALHPDTLKDPESSKSMLLHETQHAIQNYEDWPRGGSPNEPGLSSIPKGSTPLIRSFNKMIGNYQNPVVAYGNLAGEREAYNVSNRMDLPQNVLRDFGPWLSESHLAGKSYLATPENVLIKRGKESPIFASEFRDKYKYADGGQVEGDVQFADDDPYAKVQEAAKLPMMAQNDFAMHMPQPEVRYDTGPQPGEATLKGYDPTIKERIYQGIAGTEERPSPERAQFARGMSQMAEFAPVLGNVMAGQEAQRRGDTKGMLMAALPVPGMATEARMAEAAISPAQEAAREAYQRVLNAQGLYSHAAEAAYNLPQAKGSYEQMMAMLQKAGVKPEEMRWSGVEQFAGQPVTREQLASHFEQNVPKIEETVLGSPDETKLNEADAAVREAIRAYNEGQVAPRYYAHNPERSYASSFFPTREEAEAHIPTLPASYHAGTTVAEFPGKPIDVYETMRRLHNGEFVYNLPPGVNRAALNLIDERNALAEAAEQSGTKFGQYTLPGGQNYREVLLHKPSDFVPQKEYVVTGSFPQNFATRAEAQDYMQKLAKMREEMPELIPALDRHPIRILEQDAPYQRRSDKDFHSSHWDQPNVLGHLRMSDRTGPEGEKILHLEELQSDWGQAARSKGVKPNLSREEENALREERNRQTEIAYSQTGGRFDESNPQYMQAMDRVTEINKLLGEGAVPSAPYVEKTQNWVDLGLKRALKEAAEGGYSKMVWTPGEQQAARYDLSQHINRIGYTKRADGKFNISAEPSGGGEGIDRQGVSIDEVENLLGKEIADKINKAETNVYDRYNGNITGELTGLDLKLGGEGMKGFYDKIVPSRLKELLKKIDPQAKMSFTDLQTRDGVVKVPTLEITPKIREAVKRGLPAYADGGEVTDDVKSDPYADVQRAAMGDWAKQEAEKPSPLKGLMDIGTVGATYGLEKARERMEEPLEPARQLVQQSVVEPVKSAYHIAAQSTGEEPFDPYTAVQHASNVAGALTLGAGAFERPAGSLAMGASRAKDPFPYLSGMDIPGAYGSAVGSPFHPDPIMREEALKMGQKYLVPLEGRYVGQPGSYYSTAQPIAPLDVRPTVIGSPRSVGKGEITLQPTNEMSWEQFAKQGKGGTLINLAGDRMNFGRITHINEQPLAWPVDLHAGPKYMREPNPGEVWANDPNAATGIRKAIQSASERGPVYGVYTPMGAQSVNSSHNMFETVMAQIPNAGISKKDMKAFDEAIKSGKQVIGNTPKDVGKRAKAVELLKNWPGIANAKEAADFARTLPGVHRADIINMLEKGEWRDKGFPNIGVTRVAITDPQFLRTPNNMIGGRMVELTGEKPTKAAKQFTHASYPVETYGRYLGDVPMLQRQYTMPEVMKRYVNPTATGTIVHPYSTQNLGRASFRKLFETNVHQQPINQEFLDSVMLGLERQKEYGFKKGGAVSQRKDPADPLRAAVVYPHSKPKASR